MLQNILHKKCIYCFELVFLADFEAKKSLRLPENISYRQNSHGRLPFRRFILAEGLSPMAFIRFLLEDIIQAVVP